MIAYRSLGHWGILPYGPSALSAFLSSPNYIRPPISANFVKTMIGDGLLIAEYDEHKRQRRILTPAFGVGHIRAITPHFWAKGKQLVELWDPIVESQSEEGIEVLQWMNRLTLDIIGISGPHHEMKLILGFGFDFESLKSEDQPVTSAYRYVFKPGAAAALSIFARYIFPPFKHLPANRGIETARKIIEDTALSMIHLKQQTARDKEGRGERDIAGVMIEENRKNLEKGILNDVMSDDEMVNQIMTFLGAGFVSRGSADVDTRRRRRV
jgi:cytochrome P450